MPSGNVAPAAQPSPDQPKVTRDDSSGSAFEDALKEQFSGETEDSPHASVNAAESQPATEKAKKDAPLAPSVIVAILSAMTPVAPAASFGLFSAGDQAGAPATTGPTETIASAETPIEIRIA